MKYFIFFICVVSLTVCFLYVGYSAGATYDDDQEKYLNKSAISFFIFVGTAFYLWKNNFFKRND